MHLWTDYEGRMVAGKYPLRTLLRSEGRSAFFATVDASGAPVVLRLTETLNDEGIWLERWARVVDLAHPHLLRLAQPDQILLDGAPLACVLTEPVDGTLSEILSERPLTAEETADVAYAVAAGLQALHAAGYLHEHVTADNVMAVGETVKLRSDCIRECVGDFEHDTEGDRDALRLLDRQALGRLIVRCLTLSLVADDATLPAPFNRVVRGLLSGDMSLQQVQATLAKAAPPVIAASPVAASPVAASPVIAVPAAIAVPAITAPAAAPTVAAAPQVAAGSHVGAAARVAAAPRVATVAAAIASVAAPAPVVPRRQIAASPAVSPHVPSSRVSSHVVAHHSVAHDYPGAVAAWVQNARQLPLRYVFGAFVVSALAIGIHYWGNEPEPRVVQASHGTAVAKASYTPATYTPAGATAPKAVSTDAPSTHAAIAKPSAALSATAKPIGVQPNSGAASATGAWRVIAYTYNRQDQAESRAKALQQQHAALDPQVFSPRSGVYLVALGSGTDSHNAAKLRAQAIHEGLPADTFIRNF